MIVSGGFLEAIDHSRFTAFASADDVASISQFALRLPIEVHAHGLEVRLGSGDDRVDYAVCLIDEDRTLRSVRALSDEPPGHVLAAPYLDSFLGAWVADGSKVRKLIPRVWLEFDRPDAAFSGPPGCFMALAPPTGREWWVALDRVVEMLYAASRPSAKRSLIRSVVEALPPDTNLRHLGAVPSRRPDFMRLVIEIGDVGSIIRLLVSIGWPGDLNLVSQLLHQLDDEARTQPAMIDLDVTDGLRGSLGLEFMLVGERCPPDGGNDLLTFLTRRRWCSAEKLTALSPMLMWTTQVSHYSEPLAFWHRLYHIKITLKEAETSIQPVEAKAYWGVWCGPKTRTLNELRTALRSID